MGMTLLAAQPILQMNLYKAFYDAYMSQYSTDPEALLRSRGVSKEIIDKIRM